MTGRGDVRDAATDVPGELPLRFGASEDDEDPTAAVE